MCRVLRLAGGAGARAHLEKPANGVEGVALFACRPFARGAKKRTKDDEQRRKHSLKTHRKTNAEAHAKNIKKIVENKPNSFENHSRRRQNRFRRPPGSQNGSEHQLGDLIFRKKAPRSKHSAFLAPKINLAIMEREAREARELQARQELSLIHI